MQKQKILVNIFSNWTSLLVVLAMAFWVSPIIVHKLGNENYGIWTLIVSMTGYFTVLDFGVNTALVRYISKYVARKDFERARAIYSTSFFLFFVISFFVICVSLVLAFFFKTIFHIESYSNIYLFCVFLIIGTDLAVGLLFSVLQGTLQALQEFFAINCISITITIIRNVLVVVFLWYGYSLLTLAIIQICTSCCKIFSQHIIIKRRYKFLFFERVSFSRAVLTKIYNYSVYSFLIAIALKILFYTDSIVIGSLISVEDVTFYAIPSTLVDYLEKLVWSIVAVLIPVISAKEALGLNEENQQLYLTGTRVTFFFSLPIIIVLFTAGNDFIKLWMGLEYREPSGRVLQILLIGYIFGLSQLVAQGILKGISKHRVLALILCGEAIANLLLSLILARPFGIYGVALGTTIPLVVCNVLFIPWYSCRLLNINFFAYLIKSYSLGLIVFIAFVFLYHYLSFEIMTYLQLIIYSIMVGITVWGGAFFYVVESNQRNILINKIKMKLIG